MFGFSIVKPPFFAVFLAVNLLRQNTLRGTKTAAVTPERCNERPHTFCSGDLPSGFTIFFFFWGGGGGGGGLTNTTTITRGGFYDYETNALKFFCCVRLYAF